MASSGWARAFRGSRLLTLLAAPGALAQVCPLRRGRRVHFRNRRVRSRSNHRGGLLYAAGGYSSAPRGT